MFDKYSQELQNKEIAIQSLMMPYVLETNYNETTFINDNISTFGEMGFEINEFGVNSFKVSSIPVLFDNVNLDRFFDDVLKDIDNKLILTKNNTIKEYLAKKACKSAIKGNTKLTNNEINELINNICNSEQVLLCPHGRPIIVEISKQEVEKWFKRIV